MKTPVTASGTAYFMIGLLASIGLVSGCGPGVYEGQHPGDCDDQVDNDQDGDTDCLDNGCEGAPLCRDDDDDLGDDDDDSTAPTGSKQVRLSGEVSAGLYGNSSTLGAEVRQLTDSTNSTSPGENAQWSLMLPREPLIGLVATVPERLDGHLYLNLSEPGQSDLDELRITVLSADEFAKFGNYLGAPYDASRAQVLVYALSESGGMAAGAMLDVDGDFNDSYNLNMDTPTPTQEFDEMSPLFLLNVVPGPTGIRVTSLTGTPCLGPSVQLQAGLTSTLYFLCP